MGDPQELARRLARRRSGLMTRPVRAWGLALRASDRRITPMQWVMFPEHAMKVDHPEHPYEPIEHEETIQTRALRMFCRPVPTDSMGEAVEDVAKQLGVSSSLLSPARRNGIFTERRIKGLGGKRGKPIPLIHSWKALDPSGTGFFARPDVLWGSLWEWLADFVPDDFEQTLVRRPIFRTMWGRGEKRGPKAEQGLYGTMTGRSACPTDHQYKDEAQLIGWSWVCPGCKKEVRKVYYPVAPRTMFDYLGFDPAKSEADKLVAPVGSFACWWCHGIRSFTRVDET